MTTFTDVKIRGWTRFNVSSGTIMREFGTNSSYGGDLTIDTFYGQLPTAGQPSSVYIKFSIASSKMYIRIPTNTNSTNFDACLIQFKFNGQYYVLQTQSVAFENDVQNSQYTILLWGSPVLAQGL